MTTIATTELDGKSKRRNGISRALELTRRRNQIFSLAVEKLANGETLTAAPLLALVGTVERAIEDLEHSWDPRQLSLWEQGQSEPEKR